MYTYSRSQFAITVVKLWTDNSMQKWARKSTHTTEKVIVSKCATVVAASWWWRRRGGDGDGGAGLCDSNECNLNLNMFYFFHYFSALTHCPFITFSSCHCQRAQTLSSSSSFSAAQITFATIINYNTAIDTHTHAHTHTHSSIVIREFFMAFGILSVGFRLLPFIGAWIAIVLTELKQIASDNEERERMKNKSEQMKITVKVSMHVLSTRINVVARTKQRKTQNSALTFEPKRLKHNENRELKKK